MKLSARNQLKGKVVNIEEGLITAKVTLDLGCGNVISAIISKDAIGELELIKGKDAIAIIKSTEVIIGTPCSCNCEGNSSKKNCDCKNHD